MTTNIEYRALKSVAEFRVWLDVQCLFEYVSSERQARRIRMQAYRDYRKGKISKWFLDSVIRATKVPE